MRRILANAAWILGLPLLTAWPLPQVWTRSMVTTREGEAIIHAWGLWTAAAGGHPFVFNTPSLAWPSGVQDVLVDAANLPWFVIGWAMGPTAAYNTVVYGGLVLMGVAGALLARSAGGAPWLGALVGSTCASVLAATTQGITEQFGIAWVGIATAALIGALRDKSLRNSGWAALALALAWYSGPYNGVFASIIAAVVGLGALARASARRAVFVPLAATAAGAIALVAPLAHAVLTLRVEGQPGTATLASATLATTPAGNPDLYRGGLKYGADIVDPFLPVWMTGAAGQPNHTAYLGAAVLLLAVIAVGLRRQLWPWLAGALAFTALALGPYLVLRGVPLVSAEGSGVLGPAGLLTEQLSFFGRISHWYRAGGVATLLLAAPIATLGHTRFPRFVGIAAAVLIMADRFWGSPVPWPLPTATLHSPAPYAAMEGEGAVLTLPADLPDIVPPRQWRNPIMLGQLYHQRPVSEPGKWGHTLSPDGAHAVQLATEIGQRGSIEHGHQDHFRQSNFRWLALYPRYVRGESYDHSNFRRCFGNPIAEDTNVVIYTLPNQVPAYCLRNRRGSPGGSFPIDGPPVPAGR